MSVILFLLYNLMGCTTAFLIIPDLPEVGSCATVRLQSNFEINKYQGEWWEILAVPNKYVASRSCTVQNYTLAGSSLKVYTTGLDESENKVKQKSVLSPNMVDSADLLVEVPDVRTIPYKVLATDYRNYSCVYSCIGSNGFKAEFAWVFARSPHLGAKSVEICNAVFMDFKIDPTILKETSQGKICPYYPNINETIQSNENFIDSLFGQRNDDESTVIVQTSAIIEPTSGNFTQHTLPSVTSQIMDPVTNLTHTTIIPNTAHNLSASTTDKAHFIIPSPLAITNETYNATILNTSQNSSASATATSYSPIPFPLTVTTEAVTTEAVTTEAVTTEAVTTEAVTTEAVTTEAVTTEAVTTEAVTTEAVTTEAVTTVAVTTVAVTTEAVTATDTSYFYKPFSLNITTESHFTIHTQNNVAYSIPITTIITMVTTSTLNPIITLTYNTSLTTEFIPGTATSHVFPKSIRTLESNKSSTAQILDTIVSTPQPYVGSASTVPTSVFLHIIMIIQCIYFI